MNPKSSYREQLLSKSLKNTKKFIVNNSINSKNDSIIVNPPKPEMSLPKQSDSSQINYHLDNLKQKINCESGDTVHICIFTIQKENSKFPYLLYLLYKQDNVLTFPYFVFDEGDILSVCTNKLHNILDCSFKLKGFIKQGKDIFAFYEIPNNSYSPSLLKKNDNWWFTLIYEICYLKCLNNFKIHDSVFNCFLNNSYLTLLYDNNNISHEVPIPLYIGSHEQNLKYLFSFGAHKLLSPKSIHGQYYNYYSYDSACRYGLWSKDFKQDDVNTENKYGRYKKGGLVRYAVFLGNTKVFINTYSNDDGENIIDNYKKSRDIEGKWTLNYDSLFVGNVVIDGHVHIGYRYTIKDNNQVNPLSYHYLDKSELDSMYNSKKKYEII
tara:strand:+ start:2286 stop:3425 length:1140 start_codon:yes stop_codon:yes gene_type:complete